MGSVFNLDQQNRDLDSKITAGLEKLSSVFRQLVWEQAKELGLSPIQVQILIFLKYHPNALSTVSNLAKEFGVTKPTISDAVKVLEAKKLVKKISSSEDTRSYFMHLTAAGQRVVEQSENFAEPFKQMIKNTNRSDKELFWQTIIGLIFQLQQSGFISLQRMCFTCSHFSSAKGRNYCGLVNSELKRSEIRMDCPEHELQV